ncbi:RNA-directed DNA polymerase, eukaryota, nucleotide-binding alpha-beta plait domain protein, partial [Tanacetum coccineum]
MVHQKAIMDLALQFDNACTTKEDLRKTYEKCNHIPQESRALIDTFLKEGSDKDYELIIRQLDFFNGGDPKNSPQISLISYFRFHFRFQILSVINMGAHKQTSLQSKEDKISKISRSVFVTNFPDGCTARDLWNVCNDYGTVVDVFIPFKKSKIGKRFAFVRFIKVSNFDRLIVNLCTIWIGRHHLHANAARFERSAKPVVSSPKETFKGSSKNSFASILKGGPLPSVKETVHSEPAIVLDASCLKEYDFKLSFMGQVKDIASVPNLYSALSNEGFHNLTLSYLGG